MLIVLAVRPRPAPGERRQRRRDCSPGPAPTCCSSRSPRPAGGSCPRSPPAANTRADAVRVLAPALLLTAGAALALRLVLPALRVADRLARRARGLVLPLAAFEAARRPQAVAAGLLIGLACAAGTFGIAFDATWDRSQHDQADVSVGTDLALTLTTPPAVGQGARSPPPPADGEPGDRPRHRRRASGSAAAATPPRLVAIDTTRAEALLRGRLDGDRTGLEVGAGPRAGRPRPPASPSRPAPRSPSPAPRPATSRSS